MLWCFLGLNQYQAVRGNELLNDTTPGPEFIKLSSYSTQMSMKSQMLIKTVKEFFHETVKIAFALKLSLVVFILPINVKIPIVGIFSNILEQDKFHAHLS